MKKVLTFLFSIYLLMILSACQSTFQGPALIRKLASIDYLYSLRLPFGGNLTYEYFNKETNVTTVESRNFFLTVGNDYHGFKVRIDITISENELMKEDLNIYLIDGAFYVLDNLKNQKKCYQGIVTEEEYEKMIADLTNSSKSNPSDEVIKNYSNTLTQFTERGIDGSASASGSALIFSFKGTLNQLGKETYLLSSGNIEVLLKTLDLIVKEFSFQIQLQDLLGSLDLKGSFKTNSEVPSFLSEDDLNDFLVTDELLLFNEIPLLKNLYN